MKEDQEQVQTVDNNAVEICKENISVLHSMAARVLARYGSLWEPKPKRKGE